MAQNETSPIAAATGWQFWIDRGGTFTDVVARSPDGRLTSQKLLSADPQRYASAELEGMRRLLGLDSAADLNSAPIHSIRMGTTVATNALLERQGTPTVLVVTKGFRDALRIAYQNRPRIFDRHIVLPDMLYETVIEADERVSAHGEIIAPLDEKKLRQDLEALYARGFRSVAVVLMHAYRYPQHERVAADLARVTGFPQVSISHEASPLIKLVGRGDTTVVDAYLSPILREHIGNLHQQLGNIPLYFMQSNGGLTHAGNFRGRDSILSGPAGGVVGMSRTAAMAGYSRVIGFDMGGTSTDVSLFDGAYERSYEAEVAGVRMRAPMMKIHTVAAGGGSIVKFESGRYQVGPESAGADPGPACYRRGGDLTVTDANVMLGKIQADFFPDVFGPGGDELLDDKVVRRKFTELARVIADQASDHRTPEQVADGFVSVAVGRMANAIKRISVQRGFDVTEFVLCSFGGAAGQHACLVADELGIEKILIHPLAGVLSAYGMGLADLRAIRQQTVEQPLGKAAAGILDKAMRRLGQAALNAVMEQGVPTQQIDIDRRAHLRFSDSDTALEVEFATPQVMRAEFLEQHRRLFGFVMSSRPVTVETLIAEAVEKTTTYKEKQSTFGGVDQEPETATFRQMHAAGRWHETPVYRRQGLRAGFCCDGPAIISEANATTVVEPGWRAEITPLGHVLLSRNCPRAGQSTVATSADPVMLEVFNNLFMNIAEQMGIVLKNTAYSVNIKERLDFSCAVFDRDGNLVANAPHMPVHLGSMGESVRTVIRENEADMVPGDVYMLNAPYNGGTHLPDITVVTPVYDDDDGSRLFFVASRAHHADIGGITPGSMPPESRTIEEEGVLFDNFRLVRAGIFDQKELLLRLTKASWPARNPAQNIADLKAQIAANEKGLAEIRMMIEHFGLDVVLAYMQHVQDNAESSVREVLCRLDDGEFRYELDDGSHIDVSVKVDQQKRNVTVDFEGTSEQQPSNFNAPSAVCMAAVLYVFRTLVERDIPMNAGCLIPIRIRIPMRSMISPVYPAAVVAGNVETSQCITDALYGALGVLAASQGTMNNFTFGNDQYQYYETICGGSGAGPDFDGTAAVHTHMTNSRLTDPEILEWRFPVRVREFSIREHSGGRGRHRGGDGVRREIEFLEPMTAAILSNHRRIAPFGLAGGEPGACGQNFIRRADGSIDKLGAMALTAVKPGDIFVIETPGGGGYGVPADDQVR